MNDEFVSRAEKRRFDMAMEKKNMIMIKEKYPNVDTSPERLAKITVNVVENASTFTIPHRAWEIVRDLLAMLEEHAEEIERLGKIKEQAKLDYFACEEQLHDQRWRCFLDETPPPGMEVQIRSTTINGVIMDYWRPIPSLPKE